MLTFRESTHMARAWVQIVKKTVAAQYDRFEILSDGTKNALEPEITPVEEQKLVDIHLSLTGEEASTLQWVLSQYTATDAATAARDNARLASLKKELRGALNEASGWTADNASWDAVEVPSPVQFPRKF